MSDDSEFWRQQFGCILKESVRLEAELRAVKRDRDELRLEMLNLLAIILWAEEIGERRDELESLRRRLMSEL